MSNEYNDDKAMRIAEAVKKQRPSWQVSDEYQATVHIDTGEEGMPWFCFGGANETFGADVNADPEGSDMICSVNTGVNQETAGVEELATAVIQKVELVLSVERRFKKVLQDSELAFWQVVSDQYPEARAGDFGPCDAVQLEKALRSAIRTWLEYNVL